MASRPAVKSKAPTMEVITITPALAEQWLSKNTANRTVDHGARRKLSDHLRMAGHPSAVTLAAIINMVWKIQNGYVRTAKVPTVAQALQLLKDNPDIADTVVMVGRVHRRFHGSTAVFGGLYYEFARRDPDAAEAFFDKLVEGAGLEKGSPIYVLRRYLETNKPSTVILAAIMIKAWNAYIEGRDVEILIWRPVGKTAEPFPVILPEVD